MQIAGNFQVQDNKIQKVIFNTTTQKNQLHAQVVSNGSDNQTQKYNFRLASDTFQPEHLLVENFDQLPLFQWMWKEMISPKNVVDLFRILY